MIKVANEYTPTTRKGTLIDIALTTCEHTFAKPVFLDLGSDHHYPIIIGLTMVSKTKDTSLPIHYFERRNQTKIL